MFNAAEIFVKALFDSKPNPCPLFLIQSLSSLAHKPQDVSDYSLKLELQVQMVVQNEEGTTYRKNLPMVPQT